MSLPTSPDGEATPADAGAIDLEAEKTELELQQDDLPPDTLDRIAALIAAVEALRERVTELEKLAEWLASHQCETPYTDEHGHVRCMNVDGLEAREAALAGALDGLLSLPVSETALHLLDKGIGTSTPQNAWLTARTVLAATPADAMGRARAVERMDDALERLSDFAPWGGEDFAAFTKWVQGTARGALGKEDE